MITGGLGHIWGETQDMCDHRSGPTLTNSYIFDQTTRLTQSHILGKGVKTDIFFCLFSDLNKQVGW